MKKVGIVLFTAMIFAGCINNLASRPLTGSEVEMLKKLKTLKKGDVVLFYDHENLAIVNEVSCNDNDIEKCSVGYLTLSPVSTNHYTIRDSAMLLHKVYAYPETGWTTQMYRLVTQ